MQKSEQVVGEVKGNCIQQVDVAMASLVHPGLFAFRLRVSAQQLRLGVEVAVLLTVSIGVVVHGGEDVMPLARCDVSSAWHPWTHRRGACLCSNVRAARHEDDGVPKLHSDLLEHVVVLGFNGFDGLLLLDWQQQHL
jgi:hypothetical protein